MKLDSELSFYIRSLTSEEEAELNNIACNGTDVKFTQRTQVILASYARTQLNRLLKSWDIPLFKLDELFILLTRKLMVLGLSIKVVIPLF